MDARSVTGVPSATEDRTTHVSADGVKDTFLMNATLSHFPSVASAIAGSGFSASGSEAPVSLLRLDTGRVNPASSFVRRLMEPSTDNGFNTSVIGEVVHEVQVEADHMLQFAGRIITVFVLLAILGVLVALYVLRQKMSLLPERANDGRKHRSLRWHKVKNTAYNVCCCGLCCQQCHRSAGFDALSVGRTLRITLIRAQNAKINQDIYFEVWCEPVEGHPKNSRVHYQAAGSYNLGNEQLDLDWFGDEEEVVIHAVGYTGDGAMQSNELPLAELRLDRRTVERYASEVAHRYGGDPDGDLTCGARVFSFRQLMPREQRRRALRFRPGGDPVVAYMAQTVAGAQGFEMASMHDYNRLLDENEILRSQNQLLGGNGRSISGKDFVGSGKTTVAEADPALLQVIIRFEILSTPTLDVPVNSFRSSSFQEAGGTARTESW